MKTITFSAPRIKRYETDEFVPSKTPVFAAISITGNRCELLCDHCRSRLLSAFYRAETPSDLRRIGLNLAKKGCRGVLVTGGCDQEGMIPFPAFAPTVKELKDRYGWKLAVHTKLIDAPFARALADCGTDLLMLDVVGDDATLREIHHLAGKSASDVEVSLDLAIRHGIPLAPHIVIGLHRGEIRGEYGALKMLEGRPIETLVLVVMTPLRGTPLEGLVPDVEEVIRIMQRAREMFPENRLVLGCAKTGGALQQRIEEAALELGFDGMAYPSEGMITRAESLGYEIRRSEMCCAFLA